MSHPLLTTVCVLVFLIMGLIELAVFQRAVYPSLRWRHERAKATLSQGVKPQLILDLVRLQSLFLLPLVGTYFALRLFPVVN
jgi:hypothetical protein